jgi:hypothetical protein
MLPFYAKKVILTLVFRKIAIFGHKNRRFCYESILKNKLAVWRRGSATAARGLPVESPRLLVFKKKTLVK